jgi:glycosyltransferase involved in cell wall biosynthesis
MKLRICQIIPTLDQGGAEKQMALLTCNLDPKRFERHVVVLTRSGPLEERLRESGAHLHFIGKRTQADPLALVRLTRVIRKINPQIVHTWLFAANSYGRLAAAWARVPVVIAGERCVDPWKTFMHRCVDGWLARQTTCIATNTSAVVDFYHRRGLPRDMFRVIPNAVQPPPSILSKEQLFHRLKLPPRRYVIGAIGRLWPQKGYPDLIWAAELTRVALQDVWFVILGDGPQLESLQKIRDQYGAQDAVRFAGHRRDANELLTAFDLLWNGSRYEGQSNTILEAMAAGIPVVATDIPENRDLVADGQSGYLYSLGDVGCLTRVTCNLLPDEVLRQQLGSHARRKALEEFSLDAMVTAYANLYQEVWQSFQA